ncbi:zinc-dependent alcohol dehydrogenase family protein [Sphingomonas colocasiae]|uniref:NAD(P)-dependent alcohol dehydrogenase n=1 Tax=Sphingomonas colocasiae TaxID=1848973 RepID=A0ABS7PSJ9_9SPHN|nr:NAD(P)-dependent alcohol dehydrogenase [Sphingomonas colocasiae]MBY8824315.1 NAD(P)-dependent alcohol dehydrogenase [Sphingomonas colocasiae]
MRVWENRDGWGIDRLVLADRDAPAEPGAGEVKLRMLAAAVNYRDWVTVTNKTPFGALPQIPFSDACGEVLAVGAGVTRVAAGDLVCPSFFHGWIDGPPTAANRAISLGSASHAGILQDEMVLSAEHVSRAPKGLSAIEAATLPCAGLTAWRAVVVEGQVKPGDVVVVQGTGGVSIFALQFAKMRGATVIATSSSDEKLERAKALGADHLINYRDTPEWGKAVLALTDGHGADLVVEVGGAGTISQSLIAAAVAGRILVIGVLGGRSQELLMPAIFGKNLRIIGISVGSRQMFDDMAAAIEAHGLRPVIDHVYAFGEVPDALRAMEGAGHFGKLAIDFTT